jgi:hypothetical protein
VLEDPELVPSDGGVCPLPDAPDACGSPLVGCLPSGGLVVPSPVVVGSVVVPSVTWVLWLSAMSSGAAAPPVAAIVSSTVAVG